MRQIGKLADEQQARLFGDYLFTQQIANEVERERDGSWLIWVHDDEQLEAASRMLETFQQNPRAAEFVRSAGAAERHRAAEAEENLKWQRRFHDRTRVFPGLRTYGPGPLTFTLIVICCVVAFLSNFGSNLAPLHPLFISATLDPSAGLFPEVRSGEIWRLFTPVLIHFSIAHLLFNMIWLFQLGSMIEGLQGRLRFALLTFAVALISNVAQYLTSGPVFGGMSGVVFGLFGYIWIRGKIDPASGLFIDRLSVMLMMVWFVVCFTGLVGRVANMAHAGGLIVGVICGAISGWWAQRHPR